MTPENFVSWISGYFDLSETISHRDVKFKSAMEKLSPIDFAYYMSGYYECTDEKLSRADEIIKDHLALVFNKVTPDRTKDNVKKQIDEAISKYKPNVNQQYNPTIFPYFNPLQPTIITC